MAFQRIKNSIRSYLYRKVYLAQQSQGVPDSILNHLKPGSSLTYVDIGAHDGVFAYCIGNLFPFRQLYLIEANPLKTEKLKTKFSASGFPVHVIHCAVSDADGTAEFHINNNDETSSLLNLNKNLKELSNIDTNTAQTLNTKTSRLDTIFQKFNFPKIDLLKIDVQGAEDKVIHGATETLKNTRFVFMETSLRQVYNFAPLFHDMHKLMLDKGFVLCEIENAYRSEQGEILQLNALFKNKNIL
ncbi:MAG: FkbM family methyltransferase [Bacteroidota bacterium]